MKLYKVGFRFCSVFVWARNEVEALTKGRIEGAFGCGKGASALFVREANVPVA